MSAPTVFPQVLAVVLLIATLVIYRRLVVLSQRCDRAQARIDKLLRQRLALVENVAMAAETCGCDSQDRLYGLIRTGNLTIELPSANAEADLSGALNSLLTIAQANLDPETFASIARLHAELVAIQCQIATARRDLHIAADAYNATRQGFPTNLVALIFAFDARAFSGAKS